jgi:Ion transport protein
MTIKPSPPSLRNNNAAFSFLSPPPPPSPMLLLTHHRIKDPEWYEWISNSSHWQYNEEGELPMLCGNLTGARHCPVNYTCLCIGNNPNHGYTNFDNFMWSMLTTFQLITLDYWENVYNMVSVCARHFWRPANLPDLLTFLFSLRRL